MIRLGGVGNFYPKQNMTIFPEDREWEMIPGYAGYISSTEADILDVAKGKLKPQRSTSGGFRKVDIGKSTALVHNLVARAFHGHPTSRGFRVKHANGDRADNRLCNLVWSGRQRAEKPVPVTQEPVLSRPDQLAYAYAVRDRQDILDLMESSVPPARFGWSKPQTED